MSAPTIRQASYRLRAFLAKRGLSLRYESRHFDFGHKVGIAADVTRGGSRILRHAVGQRCKPGGPVPLGQMITLRSRLDRELLGKLQDMRV